MVDPKSPFNAVQQELRGDRYSQLANLSSETGDKGPINDTSGNWPRVSSGSVFGLLTDLHASGALPAILFNYDRTKCEAIALQLLEVLTSAESRFRQTNSAWIAKVSEFEAWKKAREAAGTKSAKKVASGKRSGRRGEDDAKESGRRGEDGGDGHQGKAHSTREAASREVSKWESFDPEAPLPQFSFGDAAKISSNELEEWLQTIISRDSVRQPFLDALRRGIGVHHAGMNRHYRQV